ERCRTWGTRPCPPPGRDCPRRESPQCPGDSEGEPTWTEPIPRLQGKSPVSRNGCVNGLGGLPAHRDHGHEQADEVDGSEHGECPGRPAPALPARAPPAD